MTLQEIVTNYVTPVWENALLVYEPVFHSELKEKNTQPWNLFDEANAFNSSE